MAQDVIYPGQCSMCTWGTRWTPLFGGEISYRHQLGLTGPLSHLEFAFPADSLFGWSVHGVGVLGLPLLLSHCWAPSCLLASASLTAVPPSGCLCRCACHVFLDGSLDHHVVSLVSFHGLYFKSILSDMSIAIPAFFWSPFVWNIFSPALHFQSVCVPWFDMGLS